MPAYSRSDFGPTTQQFDAALTREALPSGTRVGGYQIVEVLGGGGVGIVYLALDLSLQRQVAIKEYLPGKLAQRGEDLAVVLKDGASPSAYTEGLSAFLNQAKLLARFDHPSLVRVHSYWEEHRTAYMVMPFYNGQTLAACLKAMDKPPEEAWLRSLLSPLLGALSLLHAAACLHRGISPDNIVLLPNGQPVLLDFGASSRTPRTKDKAERKLPRKSQLHAGYSPIEQYSDTTESTQGPWTDLYALAGVIYFAITKRTPATATARVGHDPHQPLMTVVHAMLPAFPGLHYELAFINGIDKALAVQPKDRPQSVAELQALIDQPREASPSPMANDAPDDAVRAAIAAALRSVPNQARHEPAIRFPEVRESTFTPERTMPSTPPVRNVAPQRRSALPWVLLTGLLLGAAWGSWTWSQTPAGARWITKWTGHADTTSVAGAPGAATNGPTGTASAATTQQMSDMEVATRSAAAAASSAAAAVAPLEDGEVLAPSSSEPIPVALKTEQAVAAPAASAVAKRGETGAVKAGKAGKPAKGPQAVAAAQAASKQATVTAVVADAASPRAACAPRANFALVYCMQTQCKRPKFAQHGQCLELKQRGASE